MAVRLSSVPARFGMAVAAVGGGFLLREALTRWVGPGLPTYITFYPAVMVVAVLAGLMPGLAATALSALVVAYWLLPPEGLAVHVAVDLVGLVLFCTMGVFMSVVADLYRRNRRRAATYERELALQQAQRQSEEALRRLNADLAQRNEELTQQSEELSQQTEELQAQSEEIHALNVELGHREKLLQTLLESVRLTGTERAATGNICVTALEMFGEAAGAVAVYEKQANRLVIMASAGLGDGADAEEARPVEHRFAELVVEQNRTASLADTSLRPDLSIPEAPGGPPFQAVLGAPMRAGEQPFGAVVVHSRQRQEWTADHFRLAEWVAAQCAHILEILRLQDDLRRQAALIDLSPDAIMVRQMDGTITLWGHGAELLYGWTRQEAVGARTYSLLATRFPQPLERIEEQVEQTGRWSGELIHSTKDGRQIIVQSRWLARRDARGAIVELLESNVDITERKRTEQALRESEARYRLLFRNLLDGFAYCRMIFDEGGRPEDFVYVDVNDAFVRLTGLTDVVGRRVTEVIPGIKESNPELFEIYGRVTLTGRPEELETYVDPLKIWLWISVYSPEPGHFVAVFDNITDRKRAEEALRRSEEQLRVATLAAEIGVWSWIPGTSHVHVSANWRRLFGIAQETEVTFETWRNALHPEDRDRAVNELNHASERHHEFDTEYRVVWPNGTVRWIVDRGRAYYDETGRPVGMAGINVDITERKQMEEALREADRRKNEFLATLSHELRNPLAPIRYALELIDAAADPTMPSQPRQVIERQLGQLVHLVDDLLDVTRIASNKIRLRKQLVDLATIVQQAVEAAVPDIEQARHSLVVSLPPDPIWLDADADRLAQVVTNLLTNAARYTRQGGRITLAAVPVQDEVVVSVSDTGIGLSSQDLTRVFEMFAQVGEPGHGGLGIGLALVKGLVDLHGGRVEARSQGLGKGSEFRINLPRASEGAMQAMAVAGQVEAAGRRRILVVDDNADAADMMKTLLELHGHEVRVAYDGLSALATVSEFKPEIGLFDIGLPSMSGYELARCVRQDAAIPEIYLVAVTGWGQEEDRRRARASGFDAHLTKPADPEELQRLIALAGKRFDA